RTKEKIENEDVILNPLVELMKPHGFCDYVKLQMNARVVFSDSGTITEESSILNFPAINIRNVHERPEGMEEGVVMLTGFNMDKINDAISILDNQSRGKERIMRIVNDSSMPNVSEKVVRIILSYTNYVNTFVWHKNK
ncbi:uncharacterized protein METZ01_LOCUS379835, partial [marine metagenome]